MDEEKTVFTVNFKWLQEVGSTTSLKTFNNYTIIIINNMTKKKYSEWSVFVSVAYF